MRMAYVWYDPAMDNSQGIQALKEYFAKRDDGEGRTYAHSDWDIAVYFKPKYLGLTILILSYLTVHLRLLLMKPFAESQS